MFKRRRTPPPPQRPDGPNVYISTDSLGAVPGGTLRFFMTETLNPEDVRFILTSLEQQLLFLRSFSFRPYQNYLAVSWVLKPDDERQLDEVEPEVQLIVLGVLASRFGWNNPTIGRFDSDTQRIELMRQLGVEWTLGKT